MTAPVLRVIYLHGFLSSPASAKGRELARAAREWGAEFLAPDLNLEPRAADALLDGLIAPLTAAERRSTLLAGSSLGGFWALRLARRFGCPAAVVNPCLNPWVFAAEQVGVKTIYGTDRTLDVKPAFAGDLLELARETPPEPADPEDVLVLLSTADEVLDWTLADRALARSPKIISTGDDHRMGRFAECLPAVRGFFERRRAAG